MNGLNSTFSSIQQLRDLYLNNDKSGKSDESKKPEVSFGEILKQQADSVDNKSELKFSKHAAQRLSDRNISLSEEQNARLTDGVDKADAKGIKDSLVLVDSLAFIVNVPNRTVVTTMDQAESEEKIFTNIDGAVIT